MSNRSEPHDLVVRNGVALIGPDLVERPFRTLTLAGDTIGEFDTAGSGTGVDLDGAYLVPGLADCHVHFDLAAHAMPYTHWERSGFVRSVTCLHNGLLALRAGITSIRDLGSVDHLTLEYGRHVRAGSITGPRVAAAGQPLTPPGGHAAQWARVADGPEDVRAAVHEQLAGGAPVIKLMATGGISTPGDPAAQGLGQAEMTVAVEEAHRHGAGVAAHAHNPAGIIAALHAGVDTIEHGAFIDDEAIELMLRLGRTLVPTVSALSPIAPGLGIPADTVTKSIEAREIFRASVGRAVKAGVHIAAGTDAGTAFNPIGGLVDELELYIAGGMTAFDALVSATVSTGPVIGGQVGMIAPGYRADLIVVGSDPRVDIAVLRRPARVIARGRLLDPAWLDDTLAEYAGVLDDRQQ
ncbi:MAG TPA: amidohydrolase family protein [Pseudonocardiaceae bacterium]|nr:amidohydrolase family protein [Pseudonocardiaceae bacterium]